MDNFSRHWTHRDGKSASNWTDGRT